MALHCCGTARSRDTFVSLCEQGKESTSSSNQVLALICTAESDTLFRGWQCCHSMHGKYLP